MERPILFNTEMVRAILDGRKVQTRRIAKPLNLITGNRSDGLPPEQFSFFVSRQSSFVYWNDCDRRLTINERDVRAPFRYGDVLWVRETWKQATLSPAGGGAALRDIILYKADEPQDCNGMLMEDKWHPSIHMPRKAARIFLRVKDVRVERLRDMNDSDLANEGFGDWIRFISLWNSTIKPTDCDKYDWHANPWVWVIEFERMEGYHGAE